MYEDVIRNALIWKNLFTHIFRNAKLQRPALEPDFHCGHSSCSESLSSKQTIGRDVCGPGKWSLSRPYWSQSPIGPRQRCWFPATRRGNPAGWEAGKRGRGDDDAQPRAFDLDGLLMRSVSLTFRTAATQIREDAWLEPGKPFSWRRTEEATEPFLVPGVLWGICTSSLHVGKDRCFRCRNQFKDWKNKSSTLSIPLPPVSLLVETHDGGVSRWVSPPLGGSCTP